MKQRVKDYQGLQKKMKKQLATHAWSARTIHLYLRAFKAAQLLELWIKEAEAGSWQFFKAFSFCKMSGQLGPKRREGDQQIPEGIYFIDRFNPRSKYHLSLGLNYPNEADLKWVDPEMPGSDIFIHGGCETIGCIPVTDAGMEEVFLLASWARENGQEEIPVHIYPFQFSAKNWRKYEPDFPQHFTLWRALEKIYAAFERSRKIPKIIISKDGHYHF